jgi:hypothetical protein
MLIASTAQAQVTQQVPRLVVNIAIDQLSTDYIEAFAPYFGTEGFRKLLEQGKVYEHASFPFSPVDRASAIASIATGSYPFYHGIIGTQWLDRNTLRLTGCTDDQLYNGVYTTDKASPKNLLTSTIGDELKVATAGKAIVYALANKKDAAILSAGHAADGAFWKDAYTHNWCSTSYYIKKSPTWLAEFNASENNKKRKTEFQELTELTNLAVTCIERTGMGTDQVTDLLSITLDASPNMSGKKATDWQSNLTQTYINLDRQLADLVATIESKVGAQSVTFYITGTGYTEEPTEDYRHYGVPAGTFYINRTANLLNMYLGALHGSDRYVEGCSRNHIYLNLKLIEQKRLKLSEILNESQSFLLQCDGVLNVHTNESLLQSAQGEILSIRNGFHASVGGNLLIETIPGWQMYNEDTQEISQTSLRNVSFPIIIYGSGTPTQKVSTPVTVDRIAPTIAKSIHIRAPNACAALPLP